MNVQILGIAAIVGSALLLNACDKTMGTGSTSSTPAAAAPQAAAYEEQSIPGSQRVIGGFLRINIASGQVAYGWDNSTTMTNILDSPIPGGRYRLYVWAGQPESDGGVTWNAIRMETISGRVWRLVGDGTTTPFSWTEVFPPK